MAPECRLAADYLRMGFVERLRSKYAKRFKTGFAQFDTFACIGSLLYVNV